MPPQYAQPSNENTWPSGNPPTTANAFSGSAVPFRSVRINIPATGNAGTPLTSDKLQYLPRYLVDLELRMGPNGHWFSLQTPNIPIDEILDDFLPFHEGVPSSRRIIQHYKVGRDYQAQEVTNWRTSVADLANAAGGRLFLEFRDR